MGGPTTTERAKTAGVARTTQVGKVGVGWAHSAGPSSAAALLGQQEDITQCEISNKDNNTST